MLRFLKAHPLASLLLVLIVGTIVAIALSLLLSGGTHFDPEMR